MENHWTVIVSKSSILKKPFEKFKKTFQVMDLILDYCSSDCSSVGDRPGGKMGSYFQPG